MKTGNGSRSEKIHRKEGKHSGMVICPNCKHEQEAGNFCESCGQPIHTDREETADVAAGIETEMKRPGSIQTGRPTQHMQQSGQQTENTENVWVQYWHYFFTLLKNPTKAFDTNENQFVYSLVTIGLYSLLFSFGIYFLANSLFKSFGSYLGESTSLPFAVVFRLIFLIVVALAIAFFSAFAVIKLAKNTDTFQAIIAQFGGLLVPLAVLHAIGFLGGLMGEIKLTIIPVIIALVITISYIPVLLVYEKTANRKKENQRVYLSLLTVIISSLLFYIVGDVWLMDYLDNIEDTLDYPF